MKTKRIMLVSLICSVLFLGFSMVTNAATWTNNVTVSYIPGGGYGKANFDYPNTKQDAGPTASFYAKKISAALGNTVRLVNSNESNRSGVVTLQTYSVVRVSTYSTVPNYYYFAKVYSHSLEWNPGDYVTLDFSADYANK